MKRTPIVALAAVVAVASFSYGSPRAAASAPAAPAAHCSGLRAQLFDDTLEDAAVEVLDPSFVLARVGYRRRVRIPNVLSIYHQGAYALGSVSLFGPASLGVYTEASKVRSELTLDGVNGAGSAYDNAKTLFDAMTKVTATMRTEGSSTLESKASANGAIACERWLFQGQDRGYSCVLRVADSDPANGISTGAAALEHCD